MNSLINDLNKFFGENKIEIARIENENNSKLENDNNLNFENGNIFLQNEFEMGYKNENLKFDTDLFFENNVNSLWSQIDQMFFNKNEIEKNYEIEKHYEIEKNYETEKNDDILKFMKKGKKKNLRFFKKKIVEKI